jgi:hypothetical protein
MHSIMEPKFEVGFGWMNTSAMVKSNPKLNSSSFFWRIFDLGFDFTQKWNLKSKYKFNFLRKKNQFQICIENEIQLQSNFG